jgi:small-conductance mechanosensitive channel
MMFGIKSQFISRLVLLGGVPLALALLGWGFQKVVLSRLRKSSLRTGAFIGSALASSLQGWIILWTALAGLAVALSYVALPAQTLALFQKILSLTFISSGVIFLVRFLMRIIGHFAGRVSGVPTGIFKTIIAVLFYILGGLIILDHLGISITPVITALGVGGLAVALALQDTLANLFAGIHILVTKMVRPGDYIQLESGQEGYVQDITWRNTTVRALANNLIIIPNSKLSATILTNFYLPDKETAVLFQVGVSYNSDLGKVEETTVAVAREIMAEIPGGVQEFTPLIRFHTFGDSGIQFTVVLRAHEFVNQYLLKHEFVKRLLERYRKEGIEIPYPVRTVYLAERK